MSNPMIMSEVIKYDGNEKTRILNALARIKDKPISNSLKLRELNKLIQEYVDKFNPVYK